MWCAFAAGSDKAEHGFLSSKSLCISTSINVWVCINEYQEASVFLKKRAILEEEYGKSMQKLARTSSDVYSMNDGKAGLV